MLYAIWDILAHPKHQMWSTVYPKAKTRCRKVLEHLFRAHPSDVMEFIVDCWRRDSAVRAEGSILDHPLIPSRLTLLHLISSMSWPQARRPLSG